MFVMSKGWRDSGHTNTHKQKNAREVINFLTGRCDNNGHVGGHILDFRNDIHNLPHRLMSLTQPSVLF
jgi:hypothetical protein